MFFAFRAAWQKSDLSVIISESPGVFKPLEGRIACFCVYKWRKIACFQRETAFTCAWLIGIINPTDIRGEAEERQRRRPQALFMICAPLGSVLPGKARFDR